MENISPEIIISKVCEYYKLSRKRLNVSVVAVSMTLADEGIKDGMKTDIAKNSNIQSLPL